VDVPACCSQIAADALSHTTSTAVAAAANQHQPEGGTAGGEELDFCSLQFDPVKALAARHVELPYPKVKALNNLNQFYQITFASAERKAKELQQQQQQRQQQQQQQEGIPQQQQQSDAGLEPRPPASQAPTPSFKVQAELHPYHPDNIAKRKEDERAQNNDATEQPVSRPVRQRRKPRTNVFTRMQESEGPLTVLRACLGDRRRVRVDVRRRFGIRSTCEGYVTAFDKHMNLVRAPTSTQQTSAIHLTMGRCPSVCGTLPSVYGTGLQVWLAAPDCCW